MSLKTVNASPTAFTVPRLVQDGPQAIGGKAEDLDVVVVQRPAQQEVADGAADHVGPAACFAQELQEPAQSRGQIHARMLARPGVVLALRESQVAQNP